MRCYNKTVLVKIIQIGVDIMKKIILLIMVLAMVVPIPVQAVNKTTSIDAYSQGDEIKGDCLAKEVDLGDNLKGTLAVNNEGLKFIDNDDFVININQSVKLFEVIDDIDNDGIKDIAVYVKANSGYTNFRIISSKNSKILYEKSLTHKTIDTNNNLVTENSIIREILYSQNIVYLIYDHHLLAIDVNKKKVIFDHEESDNIWQMAIVEEQIIFTTQQGQLVSLDKINGSENYRQSLTTPIEAKNKLYNKTQEVNLNLWDLLYVDDKLYVSSEEDKIYQINSNDGNVIKELELGIVDQDELSKRLTEQTTYNYNDGELSVFSTGVFSKAFNGYKMKMLKDNLMLVEAYLGDHNYYSLEEFGDLNKGIEPALLLIDTENLEIKTKIKLEQYNLASSNALLTTYQGQEVLVIPSSINKGVLRISIYSADSGKLIGQNDLKNLGVGLENVKVRINKYENNYLLQINDGGSYILYDDLKTIGSLGSSKIVNKIIDLNDGILVSNNQNGKIDEICKLGLNGKDDILMQVRVPSNYLNNGFEGITYDQDSNQVLTLVNEVNNQGEIIASHVLIINVNDGNIIADKKVLLEKGIDENNKYFENYLIGSEIKYFSDLNNDGKKEILVDDKIIDGNTFAYRSQYEQMVEDNGTIIDVGDLNNDGISDLVSVGETEMRVYYSSKNGFEISYQKTNIVKKYDKNLLNNQQVKVIDDLDHNGADLFVINARNSNDCQYYQVINPKDLLVRFNLMEEGVYDWGESFMITQMDFNQDGIDDLIFNMPEGNQRILSGKDGSVIKEIVRDDYDGGSSSPTALEEVIPINFIDDGSKVYQLEDLNNDGIKEFGYSCYDYSYDNIKFKILDGKNLEELKTCSLDNTDLYDSTIIPVRGQNKIIIKDSNHNQIYDYKDEVLVAGCQIDVKSASSLADGRILIEGNDRQLYAFNDQCDFKLVDFEEKYHSGNITIKYQSEKSGIISVYDQGVLIATSTKPEVDLKLLEGKHRLVFSYDDGQGKITHITKQIEVNKSSFIKYLIILFSVVIILIGALLVVYPKYRLEKKAGAKYAKNN